ncbi:HpcH/HpaI aldolase family protein [Roseiterribacter gracilis]|uniref:HpcH/HpaI aldolase family protein n=1 Tax=Roseiterribacter gracilis TaxID=2812848 RepID=UPI003B42DFF7
MGTFLKTPSPIICEVLGLSPLDVVCIDAEHAPFDRLAIDGCVAALRAASRPSLVRVASQAPEHLLNALDCGATGVVVPHVADVTTVREIARLTQYGRAGRGYAGSSRAASYTTKTMATHLADSARDTTVIAQIEDFEALDVIDDIAQAAVASGLDALFIGRADLAVALGASSASDPVVLDAARRICAAGRSAGIAIGTFVPALTEVPQWIEQGVSLFLLASDHAFLLQGAASLAANVRSA